MAKLGGLLSVRKLLLRAGASKEVTFEQLERSKGMTFSKDECPKDLLSRFLGRYCNREVRKGQDFEFFYHRCAEE